MADEACVVVAGEDEDAVVVVVGVDFIIFLSMLRCLFGSLHLVGFRLCFQTEKLTIAKYGRSTVAYSIAKSCFPIS